MHLIMFKTRAWGCPTYMQMRDLQAKVKFAVQSSKRFLRLLFVLVITVWVIRLLCCTNDTWIHWMHLPKFFPYFLTFNVDKQYILSYLWSKWMMDWKIYNYTLFLFYIRIISTSYIHTSWQRLTEDNKIHRHAKNR